LERIGVCSGCGARFKIPESFQGSSAPCKKCDGVIKIGPAAAAAAPAAAKPAAAKPAAAPAARPAAKPAAAPAATERGGGARRAGRDAGSRRGGRSGDEPKKGNPMLVVGGIAGVLVVGGIVGFMLMGGDDKSGGGGNTANAQSAGETTVADNTAGTAGNAAGTAGATGTPETPGPNPPTSAGGSGTTAPVTPPSTDAPTKPADAPTTDPAVATPSGDVPAKTPDSPNPDGDIGGEVMSKFEFTALDKAPGTLDDEWTAIKELAAKLENSGKPRKRAMEKLVPYGIKAVPACINFLNGLDLTDSNQWVTGYEIAMFIQDKLTSGTILIPYHGDFSTDPKEINRNHKVLTSIVSYWNAQTSDDLRWNALMAKYEEKRGSAGKAIEESGGD